MLPEDRVSNVIVGDRSGGASSGHRERASAASATPTAEDPTNLPHAPHTSSLAAIAGRLTVVASVAYAEAHIMRLPRAALTGSGDVLFAAVLSRVYRHPWPELSARDYLADVRPFMAEVESRARLWLDRAFEANLQTLSEIERFLLAPGVPRRIHEAARRHAERYQELPARYLPLRPGMMRLVEDPASRLEREQLALAEVVCPELQLLCTHPNRTVLLQRLAVDEPTTVEVVHEVLAEARQGIAGFRRELSEDPEHLFRYSPIIAAGLGELGLAVDPLLLRFVLDVARLRSTSVWEELVLVTGLSLMMAALVITTGPVAIGLLALEAGVSGLSAWRGYQRARENELAESAAVLSSGRAFTNQPTHYAGVALDLASALLVAFPLVIGGVRFVRNAGKSGGAAAEAAALGGRSRSAEASLETSVSADTRLTREAGVDLSQTKQARGLGSDAHGKKPQMRERGLDEIPFDPGDGKRILRNSKPKRHELGVKEPPPPHGKQWRPAEVALSARYEKDALGRLRAAEYDVPLIYGNTDALGRNTRQGKDFHDAEVDLGLDPVRVRDYEGTGTEKSHVVGQQNSKANQTPGILPSQVEAELHRQVAHDLLDISNAWPAVGIGSTGANQGAIKAVEETILKIQKETFAAFKAKKRVPDVYLRCRIEAVFGEPTRTVAGTTGRPIPLPDAFEYKLFATPVETQPRVLIWHAHVPNQANGSFTVLLDNPWRPGG